MPPFSNGSTQQTAIQPPGTGDPLLDEALAVQQLLRTALDRINQLVVLLKQDKRQRRLVSSALGSLQKLRPWPPAP